MKRLALFVLALTLCPGAASAEGKKEKKKMDQVFEMRIYHAAPGKMKALHARFRDHTCNQS